MNIAFHEWTRAARLTFSAALCLAALALHWGLFPWLGPRAPFMFFLAAVALVAAYAGRSYAWAVLGIGLANGALLLPPTGGFAVAALPDRAVMLMYPVFGAFLIFLISHLTRSSQRAAEAERCLSIAQENTGVGLFEIDLRTRTIFASPALVKLFGRQPHAGGADRSQLMPLDEWNVGTPDEDLRAARALLRQQLTAGVRAYESEHRTVLADGTERWFHSKAHIECDDSGRAVRLLGASVDITERKRTTALLAQAQEELTQQVADLQRLHELGGRVIELDDLQAQLGASLQALMEFVGAPKGLVSLADPSTGRLRVEIESGFGQGRDVLAPLVQGGFACSKAFEERRRVLIGDLAREVADSSFRRCAEELGIGAALCTPLLTASGTANGVISVYFPGAHKLTERELRLADICAGKAAVSVERAHAQAVAQESDQRFRHALESSTVPFSLFSAVRDVSGRIADFRWTYANGATGRVLHTEAAGLIGQGIRDVLKGDGRYADLMAHFAAVVELDEPREFEQYVKIGPVDGWFQLIASPLRGTLAVWAADVTGRKRDEHALREADRRKDAFLATLAHELRNPLAPVRQAVMISRAPGASDAQKRWSHDVIERQVQHMALLLDDLLDVSRITRGTLHLRKAPVALSEVVEVARETVQPLIEARGHRLLIDIPPEVYFEADPLRVSQIIGNLLANAAKYTDTGGTIRMSAERSNSELKITVSDNGIGIAPDQLESVFEMFSQIRTPSDRSGGGLGIGLALARGLAELHGGRLDAASEGLGRGSRFSLYLPVSMPADASVPTEKRVTDTGSNMRRILVADDNRDAAETLAAFLRLDGHEVHVAYDGLEALAGIKTFEPDIALLDIGMPGLTGNEVAQRARMSQAGRNAALVAITGWGQDKDRAQAFASGFGHHLTKPVDLVRLRTLLAEL